MQTEAIFLVDLPEALSEVVEAASSGAFRDVQFFSVKSVELAVAQQTHNQRQLLVISDQDEAQLALAAQLASPDQPRWAMVVLGDRQPDYGDNVPLAECNAKILMQIFRAAVQQHELLLENFRLRGDLKTLDRRFRHDLLNLVQCIHLNAELITELMTGEGDTLEMPLRGINRASQEISRLVERFSDVIKASTESHAVESLLMSTVVEAALHELEEEILQAQATIQQPATWPEVTGVAAWLNVVWFNLIANALKHNRRAAAIQLGWDYTEGQMRFWVANCGLPVPTERKAALFSPFEHLHKQPGGGLGLSLVQRLVTLHQGTCGYERRGTDTSLFYFTLPAGTAAEQLATTN